MSEHIFDVRGMHCASCSLVIGKKLRKLPGVASAEVNYATEKAHVDFSPEKISLEAMNAEIQQLGYTLSPANQQAQMDHSQHTGLTTTKEVKKQELELLQAKTHFVLPVTLLVFFLMMWDISARTFLSVPNLPIPMDLFNTISLILSSIVLFSYVDCNYPRTSYYQEGTRGRFL
jgi:cation transport ATPase